MKEPAAAAVEARGETGERELLPRHCRGDASAFAELLAAYRAPVYGYLKRCAVAPEARDDLFQEIFLRIHAAAGRYEPSRPLAPWLFTIVANTVRSHFRKRATESRLLAAVPPPVEPVDRAPDGECHASARETAAWLEAAIADLPLAQREVLVLCAIEEMDRLTAAQALQIPVNTVKTHLRRARLALATALARRNGSLA